mmetsp:Transcript_9926/g.15323  ORF Transcript_9926/g.15323 Transcript_9926/m.15323 type:complete len:368 (+) Transcript_9926:53-1156(+)
MDLQTLLNEEEDEQDLFSYDEEENVLQSDESGSDQVDTCSDVEEQQHMIVEKGGGHNKEDNTGNSATNFPLSNGEQQSKNKRKRKQQHKKGPANGHIQTGNKKKKTGRKNQRGKLLKQQYARFEELKNHFAKLLNLPTSLVVLEEEQAGAAESSSNTIYISKQNAEGGNAIKASKTGISNQDINAADEEEEEGEIEEADNARPKPANEEEEEGAVEEDMLVVSPEKVEQLVGMACAVLREPPHKAPALGAALRRLGVHALVGLLARTMAAEKQGGMWTADQSKKRSTGGVFFVLLKEMDPDAFADVMQFQRQQRKKMKSTFFVGCKTTTATVSNNTEEREEHHDLLRKKKYINNEEKEGCSDVAASG